MDVAGWSPGEFARGRVESGPGEASIEGSPGRALGGRGTPLVWCLPLCLLGFPFASAFFFFLGLLFAVLAFFGLPALVVFVGAPGAGGADA